MPSPAGHAIAGIAAGWLIAGRTLDRKAAWVRQAVGFGMLGALPDIDLLFGSHHTYTHSLGAVAIVAGVAAIWSRTAPGARGHVAVAAAAAYASHLLLDWLGTDTTPPIGIMALWPFTDAYSQAPAHVFMAISRRYWLPEFFTYNLRALVRELVILGPIVLAVWWLRGEREGQAS
jgi:membrane-bound metal-dependent hydrolase YbcI (DUF457 family)